MTITGSGRLVLATTALLSAALLAACTASTAGSGSARPSGTSGATSSSASAGTSSVAPTTVPPSVSPTASGPLSAFERDPAVRAMRRFTYQAGRTVNSGHVTSKALRATVTPGLAAQFRHIFGADVGGYYPGPLPIQPLGVTATAADVRTIRGCVVLQGWVENRRTHRPVHARKVAATFVRARRQGGRWLVSAFYADPHLSCAHVQVRTPTW